MRTGVRVNGEFLVLDNFSVTVELENSAFSDDIIFSGFTIPGEAPVCAENNRIFGSAYHRNVAAKVKQYPAELWYKGVMMFFGTLNLLETSRHSYRWNISISGIAAELMDKNLRDLDYGADLELGTTSAQIYTTLDGLSDTGNGTPVCFPPVRNSAFYGDKNPDYKGILNLFFRSNAQYARMIINRAFNIDSITSFVPFISLSWLLSKVFENAGWQVGGDYFQIPALQKLYLYTGYGLDRTFPVEEVHVGANRLAMPAQVQILGTEDTWYLITPTERITDTDELYSLVDHSYKVSYPYSGALTNNIGYFSISMSWYVDWRTTGGIGVVTSFTIGLLFDGEPLSNMIILEEYEDWFPPVTPSPVTEYRFNTTWTQWFPPERAGQKFQLYIRYEQPSGNVSGVFLCHDLKINAVSLNKINHLAPRIHYADIVPNITVRDFLKQLRLLLSSTINPVQSDRRVDLNLMQKAIALEPVNYSRQVLNDFNGTFVFAGRHVFSFEWGGDGLEEDNFNPPADYTDLGEYDSVADLPNPLLAGRSAFVRNLNRYYVTEKNAADIIVWRYYSDNYAPLEYGEGDTVDISPIYRPIFMCHDRFRNEPRAAMPTVESLGNSPSFGLGVSNPQPPKLAFWYGKQPCVGDGLNYPYASPYEYNDAGTVVGDMRITWHGINGLYANFWENRIHALRDSELVEWDALFSLQDIIEFDITRPIAIQDVWYVISKMRYTLGDSESPTVELETYNIS